jgi:hypothetical protein
LSSAGHGNSTRTSRFTPQRASVRVGDPVRPVAKRALRRVPVDPAALGVHADCSPPRVGRSPSAYSLAPPQGTPADPVWCWRGSRGSEVGPVRAAVSHACVRWRDGAGQRPPLSEPTRRAAGKRAQRFRASTAVPVIRVRRMTTGGACRLADSAGTSPIVDAVRVRVRAEGAFPAREAAAAGRHRQATASRGVADLARARPPHVTRVAGRSKRPSPWRKDTSSFVLASRRDFASSTSPPSSIVQRSPCRVRCIASWRTAGPRVARACHRWARSAFSSGRRPAGQGGASACFRRNARRPRADALGAGTNDRRSRRNRPGRARHRLRDEHEPCEHAAGYPR